MKNEMQSECNTSSQVRVATLGLDIASICPLKIDDKGVVKDVDNYVGVYNNSKGKFCAAVVPHYNLVQHKEYFDGFAEALGKLGIKYKMIIKQAGSKAFADIEFEDRNIKFDKLNEEFITGIRLVNSYDKSTGLHAMPRFTRLACTNGMILTRNEQTVSVKHDSKMVKELEVFIEKKINEIVNSDTELQQWVSQSMADTKEWNYCCQIIEKLFPQLKHREEILKRLDIAIVITKDKKTKKKSIVYVQNDSKNKTKKLTRWEVYNAITHYLTHGEQITPHIENMFHKQAEKLLVTPMDKFKVKVPVLTV